MGTKVVEMIAFVILNVFGCASSENILPCNETQVGMCLGNNQKCSAVLHKCVCLEGFVMDDGQCVKSDSDRFIVHDTTAMVISIFTISLVVVGLVLVIRKYSLMEYIRRKINLRSNTDVTYEDVMIAQDDPPLVP